VSEIDDGITPTARPGYVLIFEENFEGPGIDPSHWSFEIGDGCPAIAMCCRDVCVTNASRAVDDEGIWGRTSLGMSSDDNTIQHTRPNHSPSSPHTRDHLPSPGRLPAIRLRPDDYRCHFDDGASAVARVGSAGV